MSRVDPIALDYRNPVARTYRAYRGRRPGRGLLWLLSGFVWVVVGLAAVGALNGVLMVAGVRGPVGYAGFPAAILILLAVAALFRALRRARELTVLNHLEQATRLNLPLPAMLLAAQRAERGAAARMLDRLRLRIMDGFPLGAALELAVPSMPPAVVDQVLAAERSGRVPQALGRIVRRAGGKFGGDSDLAAPPVDPSRRLFMRWYPLVMVPSLIGMVGLMCIFVIPRYEELFLDFGIELPASTRLMLRIARWSVDTGLAGVAVLVVAFCVAVACGRAAAAVVAPRWLASNPFHRLTDLLAWHLPPVSGVTRPRALADACHVIADGLESGRSLHWAVAEAGEVRTNAVLQGQFKRWSAAVAHGAAVPDAARGAGLPPLLVGMASTAYAAPTSAGAGSMPQVFRFLARYYESRFSRAAALVEGVLVPALVVVMGVVVGFIALSLFSPLVKLAHGIDFTGPSL